MKLLLAACLAATVFLAGCATSTQQATGVAPGADAVYPDGPLKPLAEGSQPTSRSVALTAPPADMWDRIRRGFAMPNLDSDLVRDREQWYATRPDYIQRMVDRSNKYIFHIVEELERRNMPTELALLPYIESAFNPQAVSSARAAGMWQFMPATGTDFDLKQNIFRDDRRDVVASTRAALDYLQKLYSMFGDWQLALAAYNWGEGNVGRAVARNIFLDGNTFADSDSVDKIPFVADLNAGLAITYGRVRTSYAIVYRTKEFHEQDSDGDVFGTITLGIRF